MGKLYDNLNPQVDNQHPLWGGQHALELYLRIDPLWDLERWYLGAHYAVRYAVSLITLCVTAVAPMPYRTALYCRVLH